MAEIASAYVALLPSTRNWEREVGRQIDGSTTKAGKAAGAKSGRAFSGAFSGAVKGVLAAAGGIAITRVATDFIGDSISGASDLNETLSKSRVIFGANAKAIDKWAKSADKALGLSEQAALESAASFGDMFSQIGLGERRATKMSKAVVKMAADLGSFNNLSTEDVLERIAGGFRGEYDALQKVIPNISAARVQQEALNRTHKKAVSELTAAEKAEATLAIIRKDGARAVGDFARTSDGLANSQKILAARTDNLKAAIGQGLIPVTTDIVNKTSDFVEGMQDGTGAGGQFVDVLEDARDVGKGVLAFFDSIPGPVKKYGVELLIAGVALNKINNGLTAGRTAMSSWIASLGPAESTLTRTQRASYALGVGLRNLAGAGGMLAVVDGAKKTDSALGMLETTAGAALTGFAVAGPWGAAVGAGAGALYGLQHANDAANESFRRSLKFHEEYLGSLNTVTGAITKQTREVIFKNLTNDDTLKVSRLYGLPDKTVVDAALGNVKALERVKRRLSAAIEAGTLDPSFRSDFLNSLRLEGQEITAQSLAIRKRTVATADYGELLKGFPTSLVTKIEAKGLPVTTRGVAALTEALDLTPRQVHTVIKAVGIPTTVAGVEKIIDRMRSVDKQRANPRITLGGADRVINKLNAINELLGDFTGKTGGIDAPADSLGDLLRPKRRAIGGPVRPGEPYWTGEREPELFVSSQRGTLKPLSHLATAAPQAGPQFVIEKVVAQDVNDFLRQMQVRARQAAISGIPGWG